ncbi:Ubiquinone/menaquinone biosynthesis C-methylase UbiE [Caloramator fervidus]|uniref:Ubiquinone/menaquinone biosynthesis C-methylase UbiE n=1 Tax=Caloramator fervidus TaxID=29344 RepID=A0A1H5U7W1_9CLOT|nr:class I SAM-dependent methyltransferase [Caloramator fervidus]SEF71069.1 Ubiquinone/menaquinone biosynthesis C-methylase UbiE [Caloramator fervidus]
MQYKDLALYYDEMMDVDYDSWTNFLISLFKKYDLDYIDKTVLELGCGTGNMTLKLANLGLKVIALDISQEMLNVARDKVKKGVIFVNEDMKNIDFDKKFDFVFSFCDGFNYILEEDELFLIFKKVYNLLKEEGLFVFDISSEYKLKNIIGNNTFTLNEEKYAYIWDNYLEDDIVDMYITFFVKEGDFYRRIDEHHTQRIYKLDDMLRMLKKAGFNKIDVYDNYSFETIKENSQRITFAVRK